MIKKVLISCVVALLIILICIPASAVTRLDRRDDPKTKGSSSSRVDMNARAEQYQPKYDANNGDRRWTTRLELKQYVDPSLRILYRVTINLHYKMPYEISQNKVEDHYWTSIAVHSLTHAEVRTDDLWTYFYNVKFTWIWDDALGYSDEFSYGYKDKTREELFTAK